MRGPQLNNQVIKVLPFLMNRFLDQIVKVGNCADGDLLKVFLSCSFGSFEGHDDPSNVWPSQPKLHVFEFRSLGEVKRRRHLKEY